MLLFALGLFGGVPAAVSLLKGLEKRTVWDRTRAVIENVDTAPDHSHITYSYDCAGRTYRHTQRDSVPAPLAGHYRWAPYAPGDVVYVRTHPRNPRLSILDPPLFQRLWRDVTGQPYRGELAQ